MARNKKLTRFRNAADRISDQYDEKSSLEKDERKASFTHKDAPVEKNYFNRFFVRPCDNLTCCKIFFIIKK